ncbi:RfbD dTDP-4-dehydrorhamnose reductase [Candidatus Nanopelagicaceae bacterium]
MKSGGSHSRIVDGQMSWLITGANGQLGRALSLVLNERGINNICLGSKDLDITISNDVVAKMCSIIPSVIINAAAWTNVDGAELDPAGAHAVNAQGAANLARAAKLLGAVFAHISTDYVFSGIRTQPWQEDDLRAPISVYGESKAAGEVAVLNEYSDRTYVFRTAWLYSPWGRNFVKTIIKTALEEDKISVVDDQFGQPTSAIDLANQIVDSILSEIPFGIYHATNSGECSWFDLAKEIFQLSGISVSRVVPVSTSTHTQMARRPSYSVLGHDSWIDLPPMRDWRIALVESFDQILLAVENEK